MSFTTRVLAALLWWAIFGLTSCLTHQEPVPAQPPYGMVGGFFTPSYALMRVTASAPGKAPVVATKEPSGSYYFDSLAVGTYTLAFEPAEGFLIPPTQTIVVKDSMTTQAAYVRLVRNTATLLAGGRWRLSAFTSTPWSGTPYDEYAALPGCTRDDFLVLNQDGYGTLDEGATKCQPTTPQTTSITWQLREDDAELWLHSLDPGGNPYFIERLTPTTLTVRYYPNPTTATAYRKTFTSF